MQINTDIENGVKVEHEWGERNEPSKTHPLKSQQHYDATHNEHKVRIAKQRTAITAIIY